MRRRLAVIAALLCVSAGAAHAEVWMVKSGNVLGCRERQTLVDFDKAGPGPDAKLPPGCLTFYSGERLLEQSEAGVGFTAYIKVERGDGAIFYVRNADVVADPGIGSVEGDRAGP